MSRAPRSPPTITMAKGRWESEPMPWEVAAGSRLHYRCALAYVDPAEGLERVFEGQCRGRLADAPRGERGFGYDPAFLPEDAPEGLTMAELPEREKDRISHRGRAVRELVRWLSAG